MDHETQPHRSTLLVVDDNPENLALLGGILQPEYRVRVATDGTKALTIVESDDPPDLILLDVMMPGMSGFEVCERIKANPARRDVPIIFVTALGEVEDERHGLELGAIDYVTKPINPAIVLARVRNHLDLKRAREALAQQNAILEVKVRERTADLVRANDELKDSYLETIDLAYGVMNQADDFLADHCRRVAGYAVRIAEVLGLDAESAFDVRVAALLHDIGLVGEPLPEVKRLLALAKPSATHDVSYWTHPVAQLHVLSTSPRFQRTAAIIAAHHEFVDGSGFPAGTKGDDIPLGGRILAVADRWDVYAQVEPVVAGQPWSFDHFARRFEGRLDAGVLAAFAQVLSAGDPYSRIVGLPPAELHVGMVIAQTVRSAKGAVLISAGTVLRKDHIHELVAYASKGYVQGTVAVFRAD